MSSAICFNLDQFTILSSGNGLMFSKRKLLSHILSSLEIIHKKDVHHEDSSMKQDRSLCLELLLSWSDSPFFIGTLTYFRGNAKYESEINSW